MPPFVSEALSTSFKCAEFAPPPHDAFFIDADADDAVPSIEQTDNHDHLSFKPSSASLLLPRHGNSSTIGSSRASSPSRRSYLATVAGNESRTSTPASDFSSSLVSKYGGINAPATFHATATASPGSTTVADSGSREKKYLGLLHPHPHRQSPSGLNSPVTHFESRDEQQQHLQNDIENNMISHGHDTHSPTPKSHRHHQHKHRTHKKSSSNCNNSSDSRDTRPLILLHATILQVMPPAPARTMAAANLPEHVLRDWRLIEQKLADPVLMSRGLLLPHPRDEYDLLEERLLEALELKTPRVWRCGHFYGAEEEGCDAGKKRADSAIGTAEERPHGQHRHGATDSSSLNSNTLEESSGSDRDDDDAADAPVCIFCHEPLHVPPSLDSGSGAHNRWDIRIYAANGLMRSSAWSAAWSEMERVDVAITPLLTSAQRLALAAQLEREESEAEEREMAREEELQRMAAQRARSEEQGRERQLREGLELERRRAQEMAEHQEAEKLRYMAAAAVAAVSERRVAEERAKESKRQRARELKELELAKQGERDEDARRKASAGQRMSLGTLVRNCVVVLATDRRNIAVLLSILVAFFAFCFTATPGDRTPTFPSAHLSDVSFELDTSPLPHGDDAAVNYSLPLVLNAPHSTATVTSTVTLFLPATASADLASETKELQSSGAGAKSASTLLEEAPDSITDTRFEPPVAALDIENQGDDLNRLEIGDNHCALNVGEAQTEAAASLLASAEPDLDPSDPDSSSPPPPPIEILAFSSSSPLQQQVLEDDLAADDVLQCPARATEGAFIDFALPRCMPGDKLEDREAEAEGEGDEYWEVRLIDDYAGVAV